MKWAYIFLIVSGSLFACNNGSQKNLPADNIQPAQPEHASFFPVTDFLLGQIAEIKNRGVNPLKTTIINNRQDSGWIKIETLQEELAPFLSPVIDSSNLAGLFTEKRFMDQTLDAVTFTYDPIKALPDSFLLQRWDVYIDPKSNSVTRIYLVRKTKDHKSQQLTWQTDRSCKIVTIASDAKGMDHVEKEVSIKWDF